MYRILLVALPLLLGALPAGAAGLRDVVRALEVPFQAATPAGERIQDYSAEFFQQSQLAALDRTQRARGRVAVRFDYRRGDQVPVVMFDWQYEEPTRQQIVTDGKTLWVYLPENNQVIQSDVELASRAGESDPMTFLTGLGQLSRDFQITFAEPNQDNVGNYVLDLRPRRSSALFNRMVIVVDRNALAGPAPAGLAGLPPAPAAPAGRLPRPGNASAAGGLSAASPAAVGPAPPGGPIFPILSTTVLDANGNSTTIEFGDLRINRGLSAGQFKFILPAGVEVVRPTGKGPGL